MPAFTIKRAYTTDIDTIIDLQKRIWFPTYLPILAKEQVEYMFASMYSSDSIQKQMEIDQHTFFLLLADENPIGFASFSTIEPHTTCKLHKIYVLPSYQGTGAGRYLLSAVLSDCREKGYISLQLNVNRNNKARFFYEKMGFVIVEEVDIPFGPYWMNDFVMCYEFNTPITS